MHKTVAINGRGLVVGEDHHRARYTDGEVSMVLTLREEGLGYKKIAKKMDMPVRTVRCICNFESRAQPAVGFKRVRIPEEEGG